MRLAILDLDGTLLMPGALTAWDKVRSLQLSLRTTSVPQMLVTLATGRALAGVVRVIRHMHLPNGTPIALYNGALVVTAGSFAPLTWKTIPPAVLGRVLKLVLPAHMTATAYFYPGAGAPDNPWDPGTEIVWGWSDRSGRADREFNGLPIRWSDSDLGFDGWAPVAILVDAASRPAASRSLASSFRTIEGISVTRSGDRFLEIRPSGVNKAQAAREIAKALGVRQSEVIALGDADNDAELLRWAGIGVSVAKGSPRAVASSDFVCRYGTAQAALELLRLVKHAKRYHGAHHVNQQDRASADLSLD